MNRIKEIWNILSKRTSEQAGLDKVRYAENTLSDLYLGVKYPESQRLLLLRTTAGDPDIPEIRQFKGLALERIYDTSLPGKIFLSLVLTDGSFTDIFDSIIFDITEAILHDGSSSAVRIFSDRLVKWQVVFEQFALAGLSRDEQLGLFGELYFLRKILRHTAKHPKAIKSWTGPQKSVHDFQYGPWSVEVKVTTGNNHQKIQINSERQLDASNTKQLYLYHLSMEIKQQAGETLNALIADIIAMLDHDFAQSDKFKAQLAEAGYFDRHRNLYEENGYILRQEVFYKIEKDFPRIEEKDIRRGVGDVKYSIIVSHFSDCEMSESDVLANLIFNEYTSER